MADVGKDLDIALKKLEQRVRAAPELARLYAKDTQNFCDSQFLACIRAIDVVNRFLDAVGL